MMGLNVARTSEEALQTNIFIQNNGNDEDFHFSPSWEAAGSSFLSRVVLTGLYQHEKDCPAHLPAKNNHENIYQGLYNKRNTLNKTQIPGLHFISA